MSDNSKTVQDRAIIYNGGPTETRKSYVVYRTAPFSMTLKNS